MHCKWGLVSSKQSIMQFSCLSIVLVLLVSVIAAPTKNSSPHEFKFNILDFNIRVKNSSPGKDEPLWAARKDLLIQQIKSHTEGAPTLIGLQEVLKGPLDDILQGLGSNWTHFGVGRDDGKTKGEYAPILYQPSVWDVLYSKTLWLSTTPDVPSRGWDAGYNRVVEVTVIQHKETGVKFHYMNTHLDDKGTQARIHSAEEINSVIANFTLPSPVFLLGDFNSRSTDDAYKIVSQDLIDSSLNKTVDHGYDATWTGFDYKDLSTIDFIFYKGEHVSVDSHTVLSNNITGVVISDHRPVFTEFTIEHWK